MVGAASSYKTIRPRIADDLGNKFDEKVTGMLEYTPVNTFSSWFEFITGEAWEFILFGGYTSNLGATAPVTGTGFTPVYFSRGSDIMYIVRVSPRISYSANNIRIGLEPEYTLASYATSTDNRGKP